MENYDFDLNRTPFSQSLPHSIQILDYITRKSIKTNLASLALKETNLETVKKELRNVDE